jgi:hypothetical protein
MQRYVRLAAASDLPPCIELYAQGVPVNGRVLLDLLESFNNRGIHSGHAGAINTTEHNTYPLVIQHLLQALRPATSLLHMRANTHSRDCNRAARVCCGRPATQNVTKAAFQNTLRFRF